MIKRLLILLCILLGIYTYSLIPKNALAIFLLGNTRVEMTFISFCLSICILFISLHLCMRTLNWFKKAPKRWLAHRQQRQQEQKHRLRERALLALLTDDYPNSKQQALRAAKATPKNNPSVDQYLACLSALRMQQTSAAQQLLDACQQHDEWEHVYLQAQCYLATEKAVFALTLLQQYQHFSHLLQYQQLRCNAYLQANNWQELQQYCPETNLSNSEKTHFLTRALGQQLQQQLQQQQFSSCIETYTSAKPKLQQQNCTLSYICAIQLSQGSKQACNAILKALPEQNYAHELTKMLFICIDSNETAAAITTELNKLHANQPQHSGLLLSCAKVATLQQQSQTALQQCQQVLLRSHDPNELIIAQQLIQQHQDPVGTNKQDQ